ncbi:tight adherence protein B [Tamaricihabitans halophyticus]|uniref:Tight adherence protein B n=1 Tax=Tamaricihabitans halophyticus TaxID=1262583 RepID=A0A4R2RAW6_9PSEU|nr:type II secretion system F family protein [Tamaricihabitans halophyticus]TCP56851.1 tight adherence protein B [Tamaricihabitans halophyticus]
MLTSSLSIAGLALLGWPGPPARARLRNLTGGTSRIRGGAMFALVRKGYPVSSVVAACLVGWLLLGPGGGLAAAFAAATGNHRWRTRRKLRATLAAQEGMAEAIRALALELRAGAHPAQAAASVAVDAHPPAARTMRTIAGTAGLGGDVGVALGQVGSPDAGLAAAHEQLAHAWRLVRAHGLPLAEVVSAVRVCLDQQAKFSGKVHAQLAGPRTSALILAGLPALGVLLGEAMGAEPMAVLLTNPVGQVLLAVGVALACAGVLWSARLTERLVRS